MAVSRAVRPIGPLVDSRPEPGIARPVIGTRPASVFNPVNPHSAAGIRIEPPPSEPVPSGIMPDAIAAAVPPDDPPGECCGDHGLTVAPKAGLSVAPLWPYSGVFVLPITTAPARRYRATCTESAVAGGSPVWSAEPNEVVNPSTASRSFTPIGTPASGPGSWPAATRASIASAWASARSPSYATNALMPGFRFSIRSSACRATSRADSSPDRTRWAIASTESVRKSTPGPYRPSLRAMPRQRSGRVR